MVARAEAQQRRGPVPQVREHELAGRAVLELERARRVSGSISSAWTNPRAPRCIPSCSSHSPQSDTPMSPMPIASVTLAPQPSSSFARKAGSPPPGSPATSTRSTLDPRGRRLVAAHSTRYAAYDGVSTTASGRSSSTARISRSVFPVPTGMWQRPMRSNAASAAPGDERPGVVGRDDPLPGGDAGGARSSAPSRSPSCRGRPRSAGCSSACRSCRSSSRCGRSRTASRRGARRSGSPACTSPGAPASRSAAARAMSASPPPPRANPAASFSR